MQVRQLSISDPGILPGQSVPLTHGHRFPTRLVWKGP